MFSVEVLGLANFEATMAALPVELQVAGRTAMETSTGLVEKTAKSNVPRRTGTLADSIQSKITSVGVGLEGSVGTDSAYGPFVEEGTQAHEIAPLTAMALLTDVGVFARVQHPGTSPAPYLAPALNDNRGKIIEIFQAAAQVALSLVKGV